MKWWWAAAWCLWVVPGLVPGLVPAWAASVLDFSADEQQRIAQHGPWPPAATRDASNHVDGQAAAVALGRLLFVDRRLSSDGTRSCATCHQPQKAFQDGLPVARGRATGVRNTPSLLDAAQRRWLGWGGAFDSLWAASLAPLLNRAEMGHSLPELAAKVRGTPRWSRPYAAVFGQPPGDDDEQVAVNIAKVLAAYQASLVSPRTAFDAFRDALSRGDQRAAARYPLAAQRGLRLFIGRAQCSVCHAGPAFSNGEFADIGRPFFVTGGVDSGRHQGLQQLQASRMNRLGPFNDAGAADPQAVTTRHLVIEHRHFGEFRVPGLRQLTRTAPYMHDGSAISLADVLRHYSELNEERLHADGERILRPLRLTAQETADLLAFLRSLSRPKAWSPH
jgi:cytochrome c peroxidase